MSLNKRVSTRLNPNQFRFITAMASVNNLSVSTYLKRKLFESKNRLTDQQLDKLMSVFCKRVDIIKLCGIEKALTEILKRNKTGALELTKEEYSNLLVMKHDLKEIKKGVDTLCQLYL